MKRLKTEMEDLARNCRDETDCVKNFSQRANYVVPPLLYNTLAFLLGDFAEPLGDLNVKDVISEALDKEVLNLAQDVMFAATRLPTPKHMGLTVHIWHKTR
jgi:hypothetical protein